MATGTAEEKAELARRSAHVKELLAEFEAKMQNLRGRQRALLERVIKRIDGEKIERIKKSLTEGE